MKKTILFALFLAFGTLQSYAQEYKIVTVVESIVPMGIGRSRIIENQTQMSASALTTERTNGKDSKQGDIKRADAKVDNFSETKLLNFFSMTGINFQNIASNDALISSKATELAKEGWKLSFVTSGVESNGGKEDGEGIFITRMFFSR